MSDLQPLLSRARDFAAWDTNPATRALHEAAAAYLAPSAATSAAPAPRRPMSSPRADWDPASLAASFGSPLEFGTAGLRGPMGAGSACMNEVTVMQAAQGIVAHLLATLPDAAARGLVVGYDHRALMGLTSRRFALLTAAACAAKGVRVHLFRCLVATPLVPFAIRRLGAAAVRGKGRSTFAGPGIC